MIGGFKMIEKKVYLPCGFKITTNGQNFKEAYASIPSVREFSKYQNVS